MVNNTQKIEIDYQFLSLIPESLALHYRVIPYGRDDTSIHVYSDVSQNTVNELSTLLGKSIQSIPLQSETIDQLYARYFRKEENNKPTKLSYTSDFLHDILHKAIAMKSSDIHFECFENMGRIRYRIDGKLVEQFRLEKEEYPIIINKIKIQANLDISEKRLPQDGRITLNAYPDSIDLRISTLPTLYGEKLVLRILNKDTSQFQLSSLGLSKQELKTYQEAIAKPYGILLVSGPTGSGKTTTLYATLKELNTPTNNILTIEDPIEYTLEGVNQVQLKESIGLDFGKALRTFLRQDPDIIMVGEIRDEKTANMAIRAALTGHFVLSTIHTNSAWATISRLIDMGIPPFLISNTLNLSLAQRLLRKLCPTCKTSLEQNEIDNILVSWGIEIPEDATLHKPIGCTACYYTGYQGRQAIYELIKISPEIEKHIKNDMTSTTSVYESYGISTLKEKALTLLFQGITSLEEVYPIITD